MAMMLPGWLSTTLNYIGYNWPTTNEDVMGQWGGDFRTLSGTTAASHEDLDAAISHLAEHNQGEGLEAFVAALRNPDSNLDALENFKKACDIAAGTCEVCAGIVVVMKGAVIAQLIILAVSLASGPGTLLVRQAVKWAIDYAINVVVDRILNGVE